RPDGTVFAVGSQGYTAIYDSKTGKWAKGPKFPMSPQGFPYVSQDAPGALLPNGNVLVAATGGPGFPNYSSAPMGFFEFDGTNLTAVPGTPNSPYIPAYNVNFLVLPTGQILASDGTGDVELYTPTNTSHRPAWEPVVTNSPVVVNAGGSYRLDGVRLNGMS